MTDYPVNVDSRFALKALDTANDTSAFLPAYGCDRCGGRTIEAIE